MNPPGPFAPADVDDGEGREVLPLGYYTDFLRLLASQRDVVDVITYRDLPWGDDLDFRSRYPKERERWKSQARKDRIAVLIQHDVDSFPELTDDLLREEERFEVRSNVMIFNQRVDRARLEHDGQVQCVDYRLDAEQLARLQRAGWIVGYHSNAYERAGFDAREGARVFADDVATLRRTFDIAYFSPHGGVRDAQGQSNRVVEPPADLRASLRWVHNGFGPVFDREFSDGGLLVGNRHPDELDLVRFVRSWEPGKRYRLLIHPQYFGRAPKRAATLAGAPWYEECLAAYASPGGNAKAATPWSRVDLRRPSRVFAVGERIRTVLIRRQRPTRHTTAPPVFVRGVSRSGGTLTVTLLDAHPQIAMSYELYPNLLGAARVAGDHPEYAQSAWTTSGRQRTGFLAGVSERLRHQQPLARWLETRDEKTFFDRCARGGLSRWRVADDYAWHLARGLSFDTLYGQLRFVEHCCQLKMLAEGKQRWGLKCSNQFHAYHELWPDAHFINVIRDGRDVLASQKNTGSFDARPDRVGASWAETHRAFDDFVAQTDARGYRLIYERLARDPEPELRRLCEFLEVPFAPVMLRFHEQDLTIYKQPAGHLSAARISKPIDTTKIGRWKQDLSEDDLAAFYSTAGEAMKAYGYFDGRDE